MLGAVAGLGSQFAVDQAGRDDIAIVTTDIDEQVAQFIKDGKLDFSIGGHWMVGGFGLIQLYDYLHGHPVENTQPLFSLIPVTAANVDTYANGLLAGLHPVRRGRPQPQPRAQPGRGSAGLHRQLLEELGRLRQVAVSPAPPAPLAPAGHRLDDDSEARSPMRLFGHAPKRGAAAGDTMPFYHAGRWHLFFSQPRSAPGSMSSGRGSSTAYLRSDDLVHWEEMPDSFGPGEHGECDGDGIWTGSVIEQGGVFHFFYTGYNRQSASPQTICKATSSDLLTWEKAPVNPLITPDPRWYETVDWRDPFVFRDAGPGGA